MADTENTVDISCFYSHFGPREYMFSNLTCMSLSRHNTLTNHLANVRRTWNCLERHSIEAYVAVTLHDRQRGDRAA